MNIILIGFMGSGKSSVAHKLAQKLKCSHIETDLSILNKSGRKSIKEIFLLDGEIRFREMEIEVAKKMSAEKNVVISTGGGMVINKICIDYLKQNGKAIFLSTSFEEITRRLQGDDSRPLFVDRKAARKLFKFRKKLYEHYADIRVSTDNRSVDEIINIILKKI
ncbi:MAG: shikimate kinase [bacterium]